MINNMLYYCLEGNGWGNIERTPNAYNEHGTITKIMSN